MANAQLSPDNRRELETLFENDDVLAMQLWDELAATNPELKYFIAHEAVRLFPNDILARARATKLCVEIIQAIGVADVEFIVAPISGGTDGEVQQS